MDWTATSQPAQSNDVNAVLLCPVPITRDASGAGLFAHVRPDWTSTMKDMQVHLEKLRTDAAECMLINDLATDIKKRELFARLAEHLKVLASEVGAGDRREGGRLALIQSTQGIPARPTAPRRGAEQLPHSKMRSASAPRPGMTLAGPRQRLAFIAKRRSRALGNWEAPALTFGHQYSLGIGPKQTFCQHNSDKLSVFAQCPVSTHV
jgi:hypothetical protein